jgi:molybdate transport system substrate-binding protein
MNRQTIVLCGSVSLFVAMLILMNASTSTKWTINNAEKEKAPLVVFCAASNRAVMESIRMQYEKEYHRPIQIQYGASQTLLSSIEVSGAGDLYLPADDSFIELGNAKGLLSEVFPLATMNGVVVVRRGNPKNVKSFSDLLRPEIVLVQASPEASAIGKRTKIALLKEKLWAPLEAATRAFRTTVTDVANDLVVHSADAGIVYDAILQSYPDLESIQLPEFKEIVSNVSLSVVSSSKEPQAALHFARYVAAKDRGLKHYQEQGFQVGSGDIWSDEAEGFRWQDPLSSVKQTTP